MHTSFSGDSIEPMENMIETAYLRNLSAICITEHMDIDYPDSAESPGTIFLLDADAYYSKFTKLRDKYLTLYNNELEILFGVELGLQPHLASKHTEFIAKYPFDFIIGSEHTTNRKDPYYPSFYEGRTEYESYCEYFEDIVRNLHVFSDFNSLGHLDYVVRYGPNKNKDFTYSKYSDLIDAILRLLIEKGIALEVNSSGYKYGLNNPNPCKEILLRYKELGGELLTIGSDAHDVSRIGADFAKVESLLQECDFKYYCYFKNRKPIFINI